MQRELAVRGMPELERPPLPELLRHEAGPGVVRLIEMRVAVENRPRITIASAIYPRLCQADHVILLEQE
jgi:hypothetical protein